MAITSARSPATSRDPNRMTASCHVPTAGELCHRPLLLASTVRVYSPVTPCVIQVTVKEDLVRRSLPLRRAARLSVVLTPPAPAAPGCAVPYETIPGQGGTPLKALVVTPTGRGSGPFPLIVLPSSWGVNNIEYVGAAAKLAYESGYS